MTRYISQEDAGDMVFGLLSHSDPTLAEACEELGITSSQFRHGLAYIKDTLASESRSPVIYDPQTFRYSLGLQEAETRAYEVYRLKIASKQLRRLYTGTAEPAAARFDQSVSARRFVRHLAGAQEELDLLLAELGS